MKKVWIITALILTAVASFLGWRSFPQQYGWLAFGPNAELRMLLRVHRGTVSIDLNRNGKFERAEQMPIDALKDRPIRISEGKLSYVITKITQHSFANGPPDAMVYVDVKGPLEFQQIGDLMLSRTRKETLSL